MDIVLNLFATSVSTVLCAGRQYGDEHPGRYTMIMCVCWKLLCVMMIVIIASGHIQSAQKVYGITEVTEDMFEYLEKYAPVVFFHEREKYFPISVESFLDHAVLVEKRCFLLFDRIIQRNDITGDLLREHSSAEYYLKINRTLFDTIEEKYLEVKDDYPVTVYGAVLQTDTDDNTYYVVQYWFFYWASEAGNTGIVWHELDWEMVMYVLDEHMQPLQAGYSQHYYGRVRDWEDVKKVEGRPVVFTGAGSHAKHFSPGYVPAYFDNEMSIRLGGDMFAADIKMTPEEYILEGMDSTMEWMAFRGYWGLPFPIKQLGPLYRNPNNTDLRMWKNPLGWFEKYQ